MKNKDILVRNIPDVTLRILKSRFEKSNYTSFNEFLLDQLEIITCKNHYEDLVHQYIERQNIMIEAVQRNTQSINLIISQTNYEEGKGG